MKKSVKSGGTDWNVPWKNWAEECALELCLVPNVKMLCNLINKECRDFAENNKDRDDLDEDKQQDEIVAKLYVKESSQEIEFNQETRRIVAKDPTYMSLFLRMESKCLPPWDLMSPEGKRERKAVINAKLDGAREKSKNNPYCVMGRYFVECFISKETGIYRGKNKKTKTKIKSVPIENIDCEDDPDPSLCDFTPGQYLNLDQSAAEEYAKYAGTYWATIQTEEKRAAVFIKLHPNIQKILPLYSRVLQENIVGLPKTTATFTHWAQEITNKKLLSFFRLQFNLQEDELFSSRYVLPYFLIELCRCSEKWARESKIGKRILEYLKNGKELNLSSNDSQCEGNFTEDRKG